MCLVALRRISLERENLHPLEENSTERYALTVSSVGVAPAQYSATLALLRDALCGVAFVVLRRKRLLFHPVVPCVLVIRENSCSIVCKHKWADAS